MNLLMFLVFAVTEVWRVLTMLPAESVTPRFSMVEAGAARMLPKRAKLVIIENFIFAVRRWLLENCFVCWEFGLLVCC